MSSFFGYYDVSTNTLVQIFVWIYAISLKYAPKNIIVCYMVTRVQKLMKLTGCFLKHLHQDTFPKAVYALTVSDIASVLVLLLRGGSPR